MATTENPDSMKKTSSGSSPSDSILPSIFQRLGSSESQSCLKCGGPLPASHRFVCATCDSDAIKRQNAYVRKQKLDELETALRRSGVPFEFQLPADDPRHKSLDTFKTDTKERMDVAMFARAIAGGEISQAWPYLFGGTETGKSHIAAGIVARRVELAVQQGVRTFVKDGMNWASIERDEGAGSAIYVKFLRIVHELTDTFGREADQTANDVIRRYQNVGLLAIDDLGVEGITEYAIRMLYWLIDARVENGLQTIITSNYALDTLADRIDGSRSNPVDAERVVVRIRRKALAVEFTDRFLEDGDRIG